MVQEIDAYVKSCVTCQRANKKMHKMPDALHPISVTDPWHKIGIDLFQLQ